HRAHDGDDVGDFVAGDDVGQDREIREGRAAPLHAVGLGAAIADDVAADLPTRAFDPRVPLALGDADLTDRLHAGPRGDRALGEAIEDLPDDLDRLAEFLHADPVARIAIAGRLDRDFEIEVAVRRIRLGATDVVVDARAPDERPRDADVLGQLARDDTHALGTDEKERVVFEHRLVLADAVVDDVQHAARLVGPAGREVIARAADLVEAVGQPGPGQGLEEVEDRLALAHAVEEHRGAAAEGAAHVEAPGAEPEAVRRDPL